MPRKGTGLLNKKHPHISFTQLTMFLECPARYWATYAHGRKSKSIMLKVGAAVHEAIRAINRKAKTTPGGISPDDVQPIITKYAGGFGDFPMYRQVVAGLMKYGEKVNADRENIVGLELEMKMEVVVKGVTVTLVGVLDRLDRNQVGEYEIREYKTVGSIPSRQELEEDLQTSIYNRLVRHVLKVGNAMAWKVWYSVVHGAEVKAMADERDAQGAEGFVVTATSKMLDAIRTKKFPATPNRYCLGCPEVLKCKAWKDELAGVGVKVLIPSLADFARLRARASAITEAKEVLEGAVRSRVDAAGGILQEGGWRAEIRNYDGGLPEQYQGFSTVEQFKAALMRNPYSRMLFKASK